MHIAIKHFKGMQFNQLFLVLIIALKTFFIDIDRIRFKKERNNKEILKPYPNDEKRPLSEIGKS